HGPVVVEASNAAGGALQLVTVTVDPVPSTPLPLAGAAINEDFDAGLPAGWTATGDWEAGVPSTGPGLLLDGALIATKLDSNYTNDARSILETPVLDLTGVSSAELRFYHWYEFSGTLDGANVKFSVDGGRTFRVIPAAFFRTGVYTGTIGTSAGQELGGE